MCTRPARNLCAMSLAFAFALAACDGSSPPLGTSPESPVHGATTASIASATMAPTASATGSGNTIVSAALRTFSFTAQLRADGTAQGTAQVDNRAIGEMFQLTIDCLQVVENVAIMSGVITRHTDVTAVGLTGIVGVVDAGEGSGSPSDSVTQVFFFRPGTVTCQDVTPADVHEFATPIVSGNVQVH